MGKCEDCRYYDQRSPYAGECRRYAPRPGQRTKDPEAEGLWAVWPMVSNVEWCGEWEQK